MKNIETKGSKFKAAEIAEKVAKGIKLSDRSNKLTGVPAFDKRDKYFRENDIVPADNYDLIELSEKVGEQQATMNYVREILEIWQTIPAEEDNDNLRLLKSKIWKSSEKILRQKCGIMLDRQLGENMQLNDGTRLEKGCRLVNQSQIEEMRKIDYLYKWLLDNKDRRELVVDRNPVLGVDQDKNLVVVVPGICY